LTIFEKIINREIPAHIIYEDDRIISFLDVSPFTKGHTLVVPKKPYKDIFEIDEETLKHLIAVAKKISTLIMASPLSPKGINLLNNNKETAGQTVFHFHLHIIPRYEEDEFTFNTQKGNQNFNLEEIKNIIKKSL